jgi:hypothetical protein
MESFESNKCNEAVYSGYTCSKHICWMNKISEFYRRARKLIMDSTHLWTWFMRLKKFLIKVLVAVMLER